MNKINQRCVFTVLAISVLTVIFLSITSCREPHDSNTVTYTPPVPGTPIQDYTQEQFIHAMGNGWNLGNTLDACNTAGGNLNSGTGTETSWGMPETTKQMIQAVKAQGFKTIRMPVSWHNHISKINGTNYTIDSQWMNRVKTVVDWCIEEDLFVILNIHHDNLEESAITSGKAGYCITTNTDKKALSTSFINSIWGQISSTFGTYDNHLIFEVLNEPREIGKAWEWDSSGGNYSSQITAANQLIKEYEQGAINVIRSSGANNVQRYIMVPPYAASPNCMMGWTLPNDTSERLIVSVHAYTPYTFAMNQESDNEFKEEFKGDIDYLFTTLNESFLKNGIPVVIGEASASDKNNTSERIKWVKYYFGKAKVSSMPVVLWDNMVIRVTGAEDAGERHGYLNRNTLTWYFPDLMSAMF